jgi:DNA-binding NtrC family response regulator
MRESDANHRQVLVVDEPEPLPTFISQRQAEFRVFTEEDHTLEDMEKRYLQFVLHRTRGRRQDAARILGINPKTLRLKIEKYQLRVNR